MCVSPAEEAPMGDGSFKGKRYAGTENMWGQCDPTQRTAWCVLGSEFARMEIGQYSARGVSHWFCEHSPACGFQLGEMVGLSVTSQQYSNYTHRVDAKHCAEKSTEY